VVLVPVHQNAGIEEFLGNAHARQRPWVKYLWSFLRTFVPGHLGNQCPLE